MDREEDLHSVGEGGNDVRALRPSFRTCDADICNETQGNVALLRGVTIRRGDVEDMKNVALTVIPLCLGDFCECHVVVEEAFGIVDDHFASRLGNVKDELKTSWCRASKKLKRSAMRQTMVSSMHALFNGYYWCVLHY